MKIPLIKKWGKEVLSQGLATEAAQPLSFDKDCSEIKDLKKRHKTQQRKIIVELAASCCFDALKLRIYTTG